ncbi:hypothetical protein IJ425_01125 [bacterium]|nr:hypothetical protein [bacterium]
MKINPITQYSFKNSLKNKPASDITKAIPINGYKTEFYSQDGSFEESVELKYEDNGRFFVLNEDKQGKNSYSISIPYELYPLSFFKGVVEPCKFCYLTKIKDGKEDLRIIIGCDRVLPLYCNNNGSPKDSKMTTKDLTKFRHLIENARQLPMTPYDYFDTARISLNKLEEQLTIED